MKIMTFNLRVDVPTDGRNAWKNRSEKAGVLIKNHAPLVFGAQELSLSMIQDLEKEIPDYRWIGEGRRGGKSDEFCPVFYDRTKLECVENGQFWLSENPEVKGSTSWRSTFPRICTWGHFKRTDGTQNEFIVYNTHLDHESQMAREKGMALIFNKLKNHYNDKYIPVFLVGDLNSEPDNPVIRMLEESFLFDSYGESSPGLTFHFFQGGKEGEPIDYIFHSPEIKPENMEVDRSLIQGGYPSDHYPVILECRIMHAY